MRPAFGTLIKSFGFVPKVLAGRPPSTGRRPAGGLDARPPGAAEPREGRCELEPKRGGGPEFLRIVIAGVNCPSKLVEASTEPHPELIQVTAKSPIFEVTLPIGFKMNVRPDPQLATSENEDPLTAPTPVPPAPSFQAGEAPAEPNQVPRRAEKTLPRSGHSSAMHFITVTLLFVFNFID